MEKLFQEAELEEQAQSSADANLEKRCSDYDYLVGMAIWKLSVEDKNKLLAESDAKKEELAQLKGKQWSDLYEEDLVTFLKALDAQVNNKNKFGQGHRSSGGGQTAVGKGAAK